MMEPGRTTAPKSDAGSLDMTALIEAGLEYRVGDSTCPACGGYLHMYGTICFGCGHERGSFFDDSLARLQAMSALPLERLLEVFPNLDERLEGTPEHQLGVAQSLTYNLIWQGLADQPSWEIPTTRVNYLGGLESAPHSEYAQFAWQNGRIELLSDRTRRAICTIDPALMLSVTAHAAFDEVLGGATFGFVSGSAIFLQSMRPTEGGALKLVFADDDGIWRVAAIGNRTGLTDKRYAFGAYRAWASLLADFCRWHAVQQQYLLFPYAYAVELGIDVGGLAVPEATPNSGDTKVCPECAETVKAAARVCRFCRHQFLDPEEEPPNRSRPTRDPVRGRRAAEAMDDKGQWWRTMIERVEDITADDAAEMMKQADRAPTASSKNAIWFEWGKRVNPIFASYRHEIESMRHIADPIPGLSEAALRALDQFEAGTAKLAVNDIGGQREVYAAADKWMALQKRIGTT